MSARPWIRLNTDTRNNRKIRALRKRVPRSWRLWYDIIQVAGQCDSEGHVLLSSGNYYPINELAEDIYTTTKQLNDVLEACVEVGLICAETWLNLRGIYLESFVKHQPSSDVSTARVQKHREIQSKNDIINSKIEKTETVSERFGNGTETPTVHNNTIQYNTYPSNFEDFWNAYPKRKGKRRDKKATYGLFKKLNGNDIPNLMIATMNYAQSGDVKKDLARDPVRFLRMDAWHDWMEPEKPSKPKQQHTGKTVDEYDFIKQARLKAESNE